MAQTELGVENRPPQGPWLNRDDEAMHLASPRTQVAAEAVVAAQPHVYLAHPDAFRGLGEDIAGCWDKLLLSHYGHTGRDLEALVRKTMAEQQVLPTQVYERLTDRPVHS